MAVKPWTKKVPNLASDFIRSSLTACNTIILLLRAHLVSVEKNVSCESPKSLLAIYSILLVIFPIKPRIFETIPYQLRVFSNCGLSRLTSYKPPHPFFIPSFYVPITLLSTVHDETASTLWKQLWLKIKTRCTNISAEPKNISLFRNILVLVKIFLARWFFQSNNQFSLPSSQWDSLKPSHLSLPVPLQTFLMTSMIRWYLSRCACWFSSKLEMMESNFWLFHATVRCMHVRIAERKQFPIGFVTLLFLPWTDFNFTQFPLTPRHPRHGLGNGHSGQWDNLRKCRFMALLMAASSSVAITAFKPRYIVERCSLPNL